MDESPTGQLSFLAECVSNVVSKARVPGPRPQRFLLAVVVSASVLGPISIIFGEGARCRLKVICLAYGYLVVLATSVDQSLLS